MMLGSFANSHLCGFTPVQSIVSSLILASIHHVSALFVVFFTHNNDQLHTIIIFLEVRICFQLSSYEIYAVLFPHCPLVACSVRRYAGLLYGNSFANVFEWYIQTISNSVQKAFLRTCIHFQQEDCEKQGSTYYWFALSSIYCVKLRCDNPSRDRI